MTVRLPFAPRLSAFLLVLLLPVLLVPATLAQRPQGEPDPRLMRDLSYIAFTPRSTLVVAENPVTSARYPFVDVHAHFWQAGTMSEGALDTLLAEMDDMNMGVLVNLSGGSGQRLQAAVANMKAHAPGRFVIFANTDFGGVGEPGWGERAAAQLEADVQAGAQGLKIFKNLGMTALDTDGERIRTDDPRLAPLWDKAGELGIPVLIHTGDPAPFWDTHDGENERWYELYERPGRWRAPEAFPSWETIMGEQHEMFRNHSNTTFISAHLGWLGHDLGRLGTVLEDLPNVYVELGAVLAELGRQPRFAARWLEQYKERVLFGKDSYNVSEYQVYFRTFETADDYFPYYRRRHAHWRIYGLDLSDDVLRHIYYKNALRIIPGIDASLFPAE